MTDTNRAVAADATPSIDTSSPPRSRRALLAGALGGLAATVVAALGRPPETSAAAGNPLIIGSEANNAGSANTQLLTNSNVVAFKLLQNGPGTALMGYTTPTTGATRGVYGRSDSPSGFGVQARNAGQEGTGAAVEAIGVNNHGVSASTDNGERYAVRGINNGTFGTGVRGESTIDGSSIGVAGVSPGGYGVYGYSDSGTGVVGYSDAGDGVYGYSASGLAAYFGGAIYAMSANASVKAFRIDHPLDPAGKVLMHSCVESNQRKLVYDGLVTTDTKGEATVELPAYFGALNRDLRYQLTPLGAAMPGLHVSSEVSGNHFKIAGAVPGASVCWQVTGVRHDAYSKAHPLIVETAKTGREKGRYLNPVEHGQPESAGVGFEVRQRAQAQQRRQL